MTLAKAGRKRYGSDASKHIDWLYAWTSVTNQYNVGLYSRMTENMKVYGGEMILKDKTRNHLRTMVTIIRDERELYPDDYTDD